MEEFTINKRCIFFTSGGRTATRFLSELVSLCVKDSYSVQEPDILRMDQVFYFYKYRNKHRNSLLKKIQDYGLFNMTVGKFHPLGNARKLSVMRQRKKIDKTIAAKKLYHIRHSLLLRLNQQVYAEANMQLTGLIDIIPLVFPISKTVFIIRDGRNWARSVMNGGFSYYSKRDPLYYFPSSRISAKMLPHDPFHDKWNRFSLFQRICWYWRFHIEHARQTMKKNPNAKIVKFESLFEGNNQDEALDDLLKYVTTFPDDSKVEYQYKDNLSGIMFHKSNSIDFPKWEKWPSKMVREFQEVCGDFLIQQGYGKEPQWQKMVNKSEKKKTNAE